MTVSGSSASLAACEHNYRCWNWDQLVDRLVWAHHSGYKTTKARRTTMDSDRPLIPDSEFYK